MLFAVCQALAHGECGVSPCVNPQAHDEHGSRGSHADSAVKGLTAIIVCRVPESGTRQNPIFAVCQRFGIRRTFFCRQAPKRRLTDIIICRVSRVTHDKCAPLPCAWTSAHGKLWCLPCASNQHTVNTKKNFMFFLQIFFYTLHILFGTLCFNMIFL